MGRAVKVTFEAIANEYGDPHTWWCEPFCRLAGWACPDEEADPGEPTEGARAAPPSLTFNLAGGG